MCSSDHLLLLLFLLLLLSLFGQLFSINLLSVKSCQFILKYFLSIFIVILLIMIDLCLYSTFRVVIILNLFLLWIWFSRFWLDLLRIMITKYYSNVYKSNLCCMFFNYASLATTLSSGIRKLYRVWDINLSLIILMTDYKDKIKNVYKFVTKLT